MCERVCERVYVCTCVCEREIDTTEGREKVGVYACARERAHAREL